MMSNVSDLVKRTPDIHVGVEESIGTSDDMGAPGMLLSATIRRSLSCSGFEGQEVGLNVSGPIHLIA